MKPEDKREEDLVSSRTGLFIFAVYNSEKNCKDVKNCKKTYPDGIFILIRE